MKIFPALTTPLLLTGLLLTSGALVNPMPAAAQENSSSIALAIENRILRSTAIRSKDVKAAFQDGVVTLSGSVDNLEASHHAVEAAQTVRGVESVVNQIQVEAPEVKNDILLNNINEALKWNLAAENWNITPTVENGKVTLNGMVDSYAEKRIVESSVSSLLGVVAVDNQLKVELKEKRSAAEIKSEVEALLAATATLDSSELKVSVDDTKVILSGKVSNLKERHRAVECAQIAGVTEVDAKGLEIDWESGDGMQRRDTERHLTDESISEAISRALNYHPLTVNEGEQIAVNSTKGKVTLLGDVSRLAVKNTAEMIARDTIGVNEIDNRIRVVWTSTDDRPADVEISEDISAAVARDAYLQSADIIPQTKSAHAHLYGMVDSEFEKQRAGKIAANQKGVVHVANYLTVSKRWEPKSDEAILEAINTELELINTSPTVEVKVTVQNGVPILSGKVDTWFQWQSLNEIAVNAGGRNIHNDVKINLVAFGGQSSLYVPDN
ncbi:MAG: BON domain-containing protein [Verrucomicrobiales bacterium]|nr:BON domain-containing protein [Verrucomicrobiales bacterium]